MTDLFGTAGIRQRVLDAWVSSPARFREDANAEEDLALGGYRDRLVVELAQNAADAAAHAGVPGQVRFTLRDAEDGPTLVVANTGAPLTAEGVQALATLRASAKRDDGDATDQTAAVGRFGVGFAAVLAVTDEPVILSRTGGVRFSREDTAAAVAGTDTPALAEEVRRRDGHVPVLRLPFEADGEPPNGDDTVVLLPLRDEAAADLVRRLLAEADDALLLALPNLERVEIDVDGEVRVLAGAAERWHVHRRAGELTAGERDRLLADRPTEERARPYWSVLWALPRDPATDVPRTVHAPTPTDEPLSLPALLLASFPLDPSRRHVAAGALSDRLVREAAAAYAELVQQRAEDGAAVLDLVPTGLASGVLDAALRAEILDVLPGTPMLRAVENGRLLRPADAVAVQGSDRALDAVLAPIVDGLVAGRDGRTALDALGVRRLDLGEVMDQLSATTRPPSWWRELYDALAGQVADRLAREALGTLPVPLADGRVVRGARGLLLPGDDLPAEALSAFTPYGLRVVHPEAAAESLERLGAVRTNVRALLENGAVRTAVEHSMEADDPDEIAAAVLGVVAAADARLDGLWWLGELALRDRDGELVPANAFVVPGSEAEAVLDPDEFEPVPAELVDRYGPAALEAVGVLRTLGTTTAADVALDALPDELAHVDGLVEWAAEVAPPGAMAGELTVVRDLDWVADDRWPRALELLGSEPALRAALVEPVRVVGAGGAVAEVLSYPAWWLRRNVRLDDGGLLAGRADPDADPALAGLLEAAPDWLARLDPRVRTAAGLVGTTADLDADGVELVLERLADPARDVDAAALIELWAGLGALTVQVEPPARVRVLTGGGTDVADPDHAVVADAPMWLQRTDLGGFVVATGQAADGLCDLLDLPLAQDVAAGRIDGDGTPAPVPDVVRRLLPDIPGTWWEHEELTVDGYEVSWWVSDDGRPHAATSDGLAKALAWSAGRWAQRHLIHAALTEPERADELALDGAFDQES